MSGLCLQVTAVQEFESSTFVGVEDGETFTLVVHQDLLVAPKENSGSVVKPEAAVRLHLEVFEVFFATAAVPAAVPPSLPSAAPVCQDLWRQNAP
jgi:hypothetical protein